jgi:hypothetical protein
MTPQIASPLRVGHVLEIGFPTFTSRITVHSERELMVKIVAGENAGFHPTEGPDRNRLWPKGLNGDARHGH